jgi:type II secretory pathway pseudopilin PulG
MSSTSRRRAAFTILELLVATGVIAVLAAILFPVYGRAKAASKQTTCLTNMRQIGAAFELYLMDFDDVMPDRRDLKSDLPGGYKPWTSWPASDPRSGWALSLFLQTRYMNDSRLWNCPSIENAGLGQVPQVVQDVTPAPDVRHSRYWMWRFDRIDDPVPLDNFWGKTPDQAVSDLRKANNPQAGKPDSISEAELLVDPYFPKTIPSVPAALKGKNVHFGGRNRLFLDMHVKFQRDKRLDP